jgi:hypothetical protein
MATFLTGCPLPLAMIGAYGNVVSIMKKRTQPEQKIDYGKFTDEARLVFAIANQYATERSFGEILPEHILLAMLREPRGGKTVLSSSVALRRQLKEGIHGQLGLGKGNNGGKLPMSSASKVVLHQSVAECQRLAHPKAGLPHLLLGLLSVSSGIAATELNKAGLSLESLRLQFAKLIPPSPLTGGEYLDEADLKERERLLREHAWQVEEANRVQSLKQLLADWQEASLIRSFLMELKSVASRRGVPSTEGTSLRVWIEWAERRANDLNPIERILDPVVRDSHLGIRAADSQVGGEHSV